MATTYRKTSKGISEIETRAHRLSPRLRSALIMVDGKRSDDELRAVLRLHSDEPLRALLAQGFIEAPVTAVPSPSPSPSPPPAPASPPASRPRRPPAARATPAAAPASPAETAAMSGVSPEAPATTPSPAKDSPSPAKAATASGGYAPATGGTAPRLAAAPPPPTTSAAMLGGAMPPPSVREVPPMAAQLPAADAPRPASAPQGAAPAVQVGGRGASEGSETLPIQVAAPAPVPAEAPVVARSALSGAALEEVRREAMRVITEEVGPLGASLVARLERARNGDELRRLLESASVVVGFARGDEAAAAFRARFMH